MLKPKSRIGSQVLSSTGTHSLLVIVRRKIGTNKQLLAHALNLKLLFADKQVPISNYLRMLYISNYSSVYLDS
jgi:hypothetical protein